MKASRLRLRPIVMLTSAILIGLLPPALALQAGGEILQPMAIAAIGGLAAELLVALFLMPCLCLMASQAARPRANATDGPAPDGVVHPLPASTVSQGCGPSA
jgi:Cu/Ag efflux pump CusA